MNGMVNDWETLTWNWERKWNVACEAGEVEECEKLTSELQEIVTGDPFNRLSYTEVWMQGVWRAGFNGGHQVARWLLSSEMLSYFKVESDEMETKVKELIQELVILGCERGELNWVEELLWGQERLRRAGGAKEIEGIMKEGFLWACRNGNVGLAKLLLKDPREGKERRSWIEGESLMKVLRVAAMNRGESILNWLIFEEKVIIGPNEKIRKEFESIRRRLDARAEWKRLKSDLLLEDNEAIKKTRRI